MIYWLNSGLQTVSLVMCSILYIFVTAVVKRLINVLDVKSDLKESLLQSPAEGQR